jgi:hypothetical protein
MRASMHCEISATRLAGDVVTLVRISMLSNTPLSRYIV